MNKKTLLGLTTYNHYSFTFLCLKYIEKYTDLKKSRLIVVDNGSTDGTQEQIQKDFPWVEKVIQNDENSQPKAFNILIGECKEDEDHVYLPNDIVVGPKWLELLQEDAYKYEKAGITSPYIPFDLCYDDVVNKEFTDRYMREYYPRLRDDPSVEGLENTLQEIYNGSFEDFCTDFQKRNAEEPPLDESLTHVMYYKNWVFEKVGLYDEAHKPFGNEDRDYFIRLNNEDIWRTCSSRSYCHHWLSITQRQRFGDWQELQDKSYKSSIRLMQKWEYIPMSEEYREIPMHKNIRNWETPHPKFKLREPMLDFETARKIDGINYMLFKGLRVGENYYKDITVGSVVKSDNGLFEVMSVHTDKSGVREIGVKDSVSDVETVVIPVNEEKYLAEKWALNYLNRG